MKPEVTHFPRPSWRATSGLRRGIKKPADSNQNRRAKNNDRVLLGALFRTFVAKQILLAMQNIQIHRVAS